MTLMELVIGLAITGMMAAAGVGGVRVDHRSSTSDSRSVGGDRARGGAARDDSLVDHQSDTIRIQIGGGPRGLTRGAARGGGGAITLGGMSTAAVTPAQAIGRRDHVHDAGRESVDAAERPHAALHRRRRQHAGERADDGVPAERAVSRSSARCSTRRSTRCTSSISTDARTAGSRRRRRRRIGTCSRCASDDGSQPGRDASPLLALPMIFGAAGARTSQCRPIRADEGAARSRAARRALARRRDRGGGAAVQHRGARAPHLRHSRVRARQAARARARRVRARRRRALEQALRVAPQGNNATARCAQSIRGSTSIRCTPARSTSTACRSTSSRAISAKS